MLIGFMGIKGSGKDTCADYLIEKYGFIKKSFADPLKRACQELFLFTNDQVFGTQEQKETPDPRWFGCTPRLALQYVGTDLLRNGLDKIMPGLGTNVFTHNFKLWYEAEKIKNPKLKVVIADVRFQNEIDFIQSLGGTVVKIDRPSVISNDMHQSEKELQSITTYNYLLNNTGTKNDLYDWIDGLIGKLIFGFNVKLIEGAIKQNLIADTVFLENFNDEKMADALKWSIVNGKLDILKYLMQHGATLSLIDIGSCGQCMQNGHIDVINYLQTLIKEVVQNCDYDCDDNSDE
jgi:hypothetical protein